MPTATVNGVELYYELTGRGDIPLVLVHGGWSWHNTWDLVRPHLAESFRILVYDRRSHGQSQRTPGQTLHDNVADLAALIGHLGLAPAWVIGNSYGAHVVLRLAGEHPDLLRGMIAHEPPLHALIAGDPTIAPQLNAFNERTEAILTQIAAGDHAGAAERFMEAVIGPGSWARFSSERRQAYIHNAPTFLDEARDPDAFTLDPVQIAVFSGPMLLTKGDQSDALAASVFARLTALLPHATMMILPEVGHTPHITHPEAYATTLATFIRQHGG
jgi:pimeloyl-ACP methyl ester carboxylesterase